MRAGQKHTKSWRKFCMPDNRKKFRHLLWISMILCFIISVLSLCLGTVQFSFKELVEALLQEGNKININILKYARIPRTTACLMAGAALSVSGAVLQNVLSNKLASPSVIGVNAGAGLGVTLCCSFGILSGWAVSLSAFSGSLITVMLISVFSARTGASKTTVILGGVALNSMLNAFSESVTVLNPDTAALTTDFRVGGFSAVSAERMLPASILIIAALLILFTLFNELDVLSLGDDSAQSIGLSVKKYRILFLILSALLAGSAVSFAGLLGFIGLIVPHFIRKIIGNESRYLLPLSAIIGAGFTTLCDLVARLIFMPYELPVGILTAIIGGPAFVWLLLHMKGGHKSDR